MFPTAGSLGVGIMAYAGAVAFYTLLAIWRLRRATIREARLKQRALSLENSNGVRDAQLASLAAREILQLDGK